MKLNGRCSIVFDSLFKIQWLEYSKLYRLWQCYFLINMCLTFLDFSVCLSVCLSEMLDVLIVGAGPHALILATLLLNPQQHVNSSSGEILQGVQLSKTNPKTGRIRSKKRSVGTFKPKHFYLDISIRLYKDQP